LLRLATDPDLDLLVVLPAAAPPDEARTAGHSLDRVRGGRRRGTWRA
jgi:hypothetical protein